MCRSPVFPSVLSLGSTNSAPGRPGLFAGFVATMKRSDFSCPYFIGFDSSSSDADRTSEAAKQEISQFSRKECTYMPGSKSTQGRTGARTIAPPRVAFHYANSVGTLN